MGSVPGTRLRRELGGPLTTTKTAASFAESNTDGNSVNVNATQSIPGRLLGSTFSLMAAFFLLSGAALAQPANQDAAAIEGSWEWDVDAWIESQASDPEDQELVRRFFGDGSLLLPFNADGSLHRHGVMSGNETSSQGVWLLEPIHAGYRLTTTADTDGVS